MKKKTGKGLKNKKFPYTALVDSDRLQGDSRKRRGRQRFSERHGSDGIRIDWSAVYTDRKL